MCYTHIGIILSLKKEGISVVCDNTNGPWGYYAKWNSSVSWFHLQNVSEIVKFIKSKTAMVVTRGWGRKKWEVINEEHKVSIK